VEVFMAALLLLCPSSFARGEQPGKTLAFYIMAPVFDWVMG